MNIIDNLRKYYKAPRLLSICYLFVEGRDIHLQDSRLSHRGYRGSSDCAIVLQHHRKLLASHHFTDKRNLNEENHIDQDSISPSRFVQVGQQLNHDQSPGVEISFKNPFSSSSGESSLTFDFDETTIPKIKMEKRGSTQDTTGDEEIIPPLGALTATSLNGKRCISRMKIIIVALILLNSMALPYLLYLIIPRIESERQLYLFETKFGRMAVRTVASLETCERYEDIGRSIYDWYE